MKIGVLALQGAFIEHKKMIESLGTECVELRQKSDLDGIDGIILPGGESTVQGKLLKQLDMFTPIKKMIEDGMPVLATCAGLILLSENISNDDARYFGTLPVTVKRNPYGRQLGRFITDAPLKGFGKYPMVFIRAPYIEKCTPDVDILATVDDKIVAVQYKNQIGLAFHPEMSDNTVIHEHFINMCK